MGKVKHKNRNLNRKAKWRSENQNVKNEKVKNKNRNLYRKANWRGENQKVKNKNGKVKNKNEITIWPPCASVKSGSRSKVRLKIDPQVKD